MTKPKIDPLRTSLCDMLGIELPIIAFTHCRDVAVAAINAGCFAVLGEAMKTSDEIVENIHFIRDRVGGRPFGIDLVLPSSVPPIQKPPAPTTLSKSQVFSASAVTTTR